MDNTIHPIGLVLGSGSLPDHIIRLLKQERRPFVVVGILGQADPSLIEKEDHLWISLGEIEKPLEYLKNKGVKDLVFAGGIKRPSLRDLSLDKKAAKWLGIIGMKAFGDDGLLSGVVSLVEKEGFRIVGVQDFLKNLQATSGVLGTEEVTSLDWKDIKRGVHVLNTLGPLDIGQAAIIEDQVVLSVEGAEGTDALIQRTKALQKTARGGVLVKLPKPNQSHLIDLPTIGLQTLENVKSSGLKGIAIGAKSTLILDRETFIKTANEMKIFLVALDLNLKEGS